MSFVYSIMCYGQVNIAGRLVASFAERTETSRQKQAGYMHFTALFTLTDVFLFMVFCAFSPSACSQLLWAMNADIQSLLTWDLASKCKPNKSMAMMATFKMRNPKQIVKCFICFISKMHISRTRHMRSITGNTGCWWWPVEDSIERNPPNFDQFGWSSLRNTLEIYCKLHPMLRSGGIQIPSPRQQEVDTTGQIGGDGP